MAESRNPLSGECMQMLHDATLLARGLRRRVSFGLHGGDAKVLRGLL